tara:strand:+ start:80 stop:280 length:201 start_codon:yes stop_codon:yes gene_type:complete
MNINSLFPTRRRSTMKVEVSCFIGGMDIKEIVHVDKFEDAEKAAKSRNKFCRQVSRKVLIEKNHIK